MNKGSIILLMLFMTACVSCLSDKQKEQEAQKKADAEFQTIDMTSIDRYPLFDDCDEMLITSNCFYENLHQVIDQKLRSGILPLRLEDKDSVLASITVSKDGRIVYDSIFTCATAIDRLRMDVLLKERLVDFPVIKSAIKRSTPVSTTYRLPIVLRPIDSLEH